MKGQTRAATLSDTEDEDENEDMDSNKFSEWTRIPRGAVVTDAKRDRLNAIRDDTESEGDSGDEKFQIVDDEGNQESEVDDEDDVGQLAKKFKSAPAVERLSRNVVSKLSHSS